MAKKKLIPDEPLSFMARLKQHHLYGVVATYAVVVGFLIQLVSRAFPYFGWSGSVPTVIIVLLLGFPVVIVLAWLFIKPKDRDRSDSWQRRHWKLGAAVTVVVMVLVVISGFYALRFSQHHAEQLAAGTIAPAPVATIPAKSVAVLPFENLSTDQGNAYFARGIQDLILTKLAGIGDLKVISRTSTESYGSYPQDLVTIAQQLGVATILEGSVQKAGNQVLINVRLIDAQTGNHLWADSYTRTLDNIFGIEGEVAEKVATALDAKLTTAERSRVDAAPTTDSVAFSLYLLANSHANRAYDQILLSSVELPQAIALYQQALAQDPRFALAAASLAVAQMNMYWKGSVRAKTQLAIAKAAADQALTLQPDLGMGQYAMALYYYWGHRDYATALRWNEMAHRSMPNRSEVEALSAFIARRQGQWTKALASLHQVALHDPRRAIWYDQLAITYALLRRYADADVAFAQAAMVAREPDDELVTRAQIEVLWKGDLGSLRTALGALTPGTGAYIGNVQRFYWFDWLSRDYRAAITKASTNVAAAWIDNSSVALPRQLFLAWAYTAAGDRVNAEQNYTAVQTSMRARLVQDPNDAEVHLALAFAYAGLGLKPAAVYEGRKAAELMPISHDAYTGAAILAYLAQLHVRVGDNKRAIELLRQLLAMPAGLSISTAVLKLDPVWDPIRNDPRFQALLKKYAIDNPETHGGG